MLKMENPHDLEAEKALIGCVLIDKDCFPVVGDQLEPSDFYVESHQEIWKAFRILQATGQNVELINLNTQLTKQDPLMAKKAYSELVECIENVVSSAYGPTYVKTIKNKSLLRQLLRLGKEVAYLSQDQEAEADKVIGTTEKALLNIADRVRGERPTRSPEIIKEVVEDIRKVKEEGWQGFDTKFAELDERVGGFIRGQTWIIGAYTGTGKTWMLLQMILNVLEQGAKVILFSTEMDRKMIMLRLIGNIARLGALQMMKNRMIDDEVERMQKAKELMEKYKDQLVIYDNVKTIDGIRLKIKKMQANGGCDIAIVDYIQNLKGDKNIYERMADAATQLYDMGGDMNITMVVASQVSQNSAGWSNKESIDFKGAGEIAAVSDVAIWLSKTKEDKFTRNIMIRKARHGEPGKFVVKVDFPSGRITALDGTEEQRDVDEVKKQLETMP